MKTIVGGIRYGKDGEWANARMVMVQFRGVADKNVEQFRQPGKQVIVEPASYKTGEVLPFDKARK
jgi:branched-chain amino acid transport system substrate-binding protein